MAKCDTVESIRDKACAVLKASGSHNDPAFLFVLDSAEHVGRGISTSVIANWIVEPVRGVLEKKRDKV